MSGRLRFGIRVKPRARADRVGGRWGPADDLVVAVRAPAVDGKANAAVVAVLADAFGVTRRQVTIVGGATARTKVVEISDAEPDGAETLRRLLAG